LGSLKQPLNLISQYYFDILAFLDAENFL
jgi:hypothetical protein